MRGANLMHIGTRDSLSGSFSMQQIDVSGLPESVAQAIDTMVQALRRQLGQSAPKAAARELPRWDGQVIGTLRREEIYDDVR
jgi:hypothetical protein